MSGCGTRIVLRGQKPLAFCDRCPCFGSLFPPLAALTFAASSIICAFGLAAAAPRSPYRHLELCGIALSNTRAKCRIGTAKFFTLLLLLYHTSVKASGMTAVVLALLVGLYFLISGLQHKSATIHCQKIAQTPPPKQDFVGRGRSFYSFIYGNTAQFPPSGLSTASAAAALRIMRYCLISCPIGT